MRFFSCGASAAARSEQRSEQRVARRPGRRAPAPPGSPSPSPAASRRRRRRTGCPPWCSLRTPRDGGRQRRTGAASAQPRTLVHVLPASAAAAHELHDDVVCDAVGGSGRERARRRRVSARRKPKPSGAALHCAAPLDSCRFGGGKSSMFTFVGATKVDGRLPSAVQRVVTCSALKPEPREAAAAGMAGATAAHSHSHEHCGRRSNAARGGA